MFELHAGILVAGTTCIHCGLAAVRCSCGPSDPRAPRHGVAEVFFGMSGPQRA